MIIGELNMKETQLSDLLPYDPSTKKNGCVKKGLKEYQALLKALIEAVHSLRARDFEKFDSLVGENACEIRAIAVALIALNSLVKVDDLNDLALVSLNKVDLLLKPSSIDLLMRSEESLKSLFEREGLDISLANDELFIILSFLLTEMKTVMASEKQINSIYRVEASDPKKICRFGDVSISFARGLISKTKRMLATASVQFVRSYACRFQDQPLMRMVSEEFTVLQNTLPCTPMFWTYKTILRAAQEEGVPLVIHVKFIEKNEGGYAVVGQDYMIFESVNGSFVEVAAENVDLEKPACIVQGVVSNENGQSLTKAEWKELMRETAVADVILAGAADHRQFPDQALDANIEQLQDSEYENYKAMAKGNGFSDENPTTFFIQHVYAACIGKVVRRMQIETLNLAQLRELVKISSRSRPVPTFESRFAGVG